jgi:hypothetical protein
VSAALVDVDPAPADPCPDGCDPADVVPIDAMDDGCNRCHRVGPNLTTR